MEEEVGFELEDLESEMGIRAGEEHDYTKGVSWHLLNTLYYIHATLYVYIFNPYNTSGRRAILFPFSDEEKSSLTYSDPPEDQSLVRGCTQDACLSLCFSQPGSQGRTLRNVTSLFEVRLFI